jgi:iron(III) transport system substrate-binding protein
MKANLGICCGALATLVLAGCWSSSSPQVVVYTALDAEFSQPIFDDFQRETHIQVLPKFDVESTKTVGLAGALVAERDRPRADVFWNNEILHTIRLESLGLLEPYVPAAAGNYPEMYRARDETWCGFAARARVLLINTRRVPQNRRPHSMEDLADPQWRGQTAMAKPLFGTTATQAACLFSVWGDARARDYFHRLYANKVQIMSGNKQVALAVAAGQAAFGVTDTDDAIAEVDRGQPVEIVYPDQRSGELGTLFIPNTVAILKNCPHPQEARRLVEYLLAPGVEARLAAGSSAQIPLSRQERATVRVATPASIRPMEVDFAAAAQAWDAAAEFLRGEFTGD